METYCFCTVSFYYYYYYSSRRELVRPNSQRLMMRSLLSFTGRWIPISRGALRSWNFQNRRRCHGNRERMSLLLLLLLSLPNKVGRLIVFAPFLIIIIIFIFIIIILLFLLLSFCGPWTCPRQISGTTGQNFMKLGGVIDICF